MSVSQEQEAIIATPEEIEAALAKGDLIQRVIRGDSAAIALCARVLRFGQVVAEIDAMLDEINCIERADDEARQAGARYV